MAYWLASDIEEREEITFPENIHDCYYSFHGVELSKNKSSCFDYIAYQKCAIDAGIDRMELSERQYWEIECKWASDRFNREWLHRLFKAIENCPENECNDIYRHIPALDIDLSFLAT